ncbi:prepilin-type N-terminal cleavage/methylation domain protein [Pseudoalteromonas luteoviolacea 2ta16]|uniref:Type II secretion system protein H n=2 Tax=Pseudoalteromonas luteoviolacea TaxID=43657 RepID=V4HSP3_PSEL2|nr:prepilin-type N-terminal cleavage/methylation domain protein [Pseudoalteromonas luteoviolacea 2ta16]
MWVGKRTIQGFSMLELIITLLICAIVIMLAIPSMSEILIVNRPKNALMHLDRLVSFARLKAIYSGERITLCPLIENRCSRGYWDKELTLFIDRGKLGWLDSRDTILRVTSKIAANDELTYQRNAITFKHTGTTWGLGNGTFTYCVTHSDGTKSGKSLSLSTTGRTRLKDTSRCLY